MNITDKERLIQQWMEGARTEPDGPRRLLENMAFELGERDRQPEFFEQWEASLREHFTNHREFNKGQHE